MIRRTARDEGLMLFPDAYRREQFTERQEIEFEAKQAHQETYGCPHDCKCESYRDCPNVEPL